MSGDVAAEVAAVEQACEIMHDAYEDAAREAGWETQQRSRKPWSEVPDANKVTMRAAVRALLDSPLIAERVRAAQAEALREFYARWFGVGWPGPEDIQEMHADLAAKIGGR